MQQFEEGFRRRLMEGHFRLLLRISACAIKNPIGRLLLKTRASDWSAAGRRCQTTCHTSIPITLLWFSIDVIFACVPGRLILIYCPEIANFEIGIILDCDVGRRKTYRPKRTLSRTQRKSYLSVIASHFQRKRGVGVELTFDIPGWRYRCFPLIRDRSSCYQSSIITHICGID
jgi:hypothetical protein